jgi:hypothetical protein
MVKRRLLLRTMALSQLLPGDFADLPASARVGKESAAQDGECGRVIEIGRRVKIGST